MSRKTKGNSIIDGLPQNQQDCIERWLFEENVSFDQARDRLFQDFGVRVSSMALSRWRQRRAQVRMLDRIAQSAQTANAVVAKFDENPADTYRALIGMVGKIAFDKAMQEQLDAETIYNFAKLLIADKKENVREEALAIAKQKLELDFEKYRDQVADAKKEIEAQVRSAKGGGLSADGLRKIEEAAAIL